MKLLDILSAPLEGVNLIEASAGTGKTYAIEGLYIRLLLEKQLTLDQILVVTFTRSATEELKTRIRQKLTLAKAGFDDAASPDPFIRDLCAQTKDHRQASEHIQNTLVNFDKAAIYTIHGFCQRILAESAFETRNLFDFEVISDQSGLLYEIVDDFWRIHFYQAPMEVVSRAIKQFSGPEYFYRLSAKAVRSDLLVFPPSKRPGMKAVNAYRALFNELAGAWKTEAQEVLELLKDPSLNGTVYGSAKPDAQYPGSSKRDTAILNLRKSMDQFIANDRPEFPLFKKFELFTRTKLLSTGKKSLAPPQHPFFDLCDNLYEKAKQVDAEVDDFLVFLKSEFFRYAAAALSKRKKRSNQISFDDLLIMVKRALDRQGGADLVKRIRQIYKAALVDEFQDTDTIQYHIFSRLFGSGDATLFMIGDPKQAIYSFRGADIFSYMEAAAHADTPYTLLKNFRSDPLLIDAVNTIFSSCHDPFLFPGIAFEKAESGKTDGDLTPSKSGLVLWHFFSDSYREEDQAVSKSDALQRVSHAVAGEIIKLASQEENGVQFGDIAILVRTNRQAKRIKDHLFGQSIPCVLYQTGNVFKTDEALEIQQFLWGLAESGDERRMAAAMSTDLMGVNGSEFDNLQSSMTVENKIASIKKYSAVWETEGFMRMFRRVMTEQQVKQRLMQYPDGERRLTNLLHLSEILHQAEIENSLGMSELIRWLAKKTVSFSFDAEEHLIRLETDACAVNILTIHKSKGLEFPIVFCPFPWDESAVYEKEVEFHDSTQNNRLVIDLGSERFDEHKKTAEKERLAENLRLFYVSLTRAKNKCYMAWGRVKGAETSAPAYLFHCAHHGDDPLSELVKTLSGKNDEKLLKDLGALCGRSHGAISLCPLPSSNGNERPRCKEEKGGNLSLRAFSGAISNTFRVVSYSSLSAGKVHVNDVLDKYSDTVAAFLDESAAKGYQDPGIGQNFSDISRFPKGTRSGLFFHSVFENIIFSSFLKYPDRSPVARQLMAHGFDPAWEPAVIQMISNVISTALHTPEGDIRLCLISEENRLNEMEFYFPVKKISPETLTRLFEFSGLGKPFDGYHQNLEGLTFAPLEGFMKGFIDMVFIHKDRFYIVDWKSNCLGPTRSHYHRNKIHETMKDHHYILQYHLYALALHCHLSMRIPNYSYKKNFGGVFYLFVRGMDPASNNSNGIYFDQPDEQFMETMRESLMPGTVTRNITLVEH
jgi:exodeoxyribonuclease V beta subunit